jgi:hypothetical protein
MHDRHIHVDFKLYISTISEDERLARGNKDLQISAGQSSVDGKADICQLIP